MESKHHALGILWFLWFVISACLVAVFRPTIVRSIEQSGIPALMSQKTNGQLSPDYRAVDACFVDSSATFSLYPIRQKRLGGDMYHDALEALLAGPDEAAIRDGAATFIRKGTRLIGCTLSKKTLFISLSKEFLNSPDLNKAYRQIEKTATDFTQVDAIMLIVDGKPFTLQK